jgi:hypothetical protein
MASILDVFAVFEGVQRVTLAQIFSVTTIERVPVVPVGGVQCVNAGTAVQIVRIKGELPGTEGVVSTLAIDCVVFLAFDENVTLVSTRDGGRLSRGSE